MPKNSPISSSVKNWIPQNFIVGVKDFQGSKELQHFLKEYPVVGLALFNSPHDHPSNIWKDAEGSLDGVYDFIKSVESKVSILAVDQEGGRVRRLRGHFIQLPSARKVSEACENAPNTHLLNEVSELYRLAAKQMAISGFHLNFAPVCDLRYPKSNNVIGDRSFGESVEVVVSMVEKFCRAFEETDVLTTLKHFPGHGPSTFDSHEKAAILFKEKRELFESDTKVFQKCSKFASAIMTAHISYPEIEDRILSIDPELFAEAKKLIKKNMLWVTDDLASMKAVNEREPCLRALDCGYDLILLCGTFDQAAKAIEETIRYAEENFNEFQVRDNYEKQRIKVRTRFEVLQKNVITFAAWKKQILSLKYESEKVLAALGNPA